MQIVSCMLSIQPTNKMYAKYITFKKYVVLNGTTFYFLCRASQFKKEFSQRDNIFVIWPQYYKIVSTCSISTTLIYVVD